MNTDHTELFSTSGALLDLTLERFLAGELDPAEAAAVEKHLAAHPPDKVRLEEVRADEARFRAAPLPAWLVAAQGGPGLSTDTPAGAPDLAPTEVMEPPPFDEAPRDEPRPVAANDHRGWQGLVVALAAAALVFVTVPGGGLSPSVEGSTTTSGHRTAATAGDLRPKGNSLELGVFTETGDRLRSGAAVRPGERLGFQVRSGDGGYLAIVGLDAAGTAWAGYPQGDTEAAPIGQSAELEDLEAAIRLDDQGDRERLVAVRCQEAFSMGELQAQVAAAAQGVDGEAPLNPVRPGCAQDEIVLRKDGG